MTNDKRTVETEAREIIYSDDFFKQYAEIVPEVGEKLEQYVFKIVELLTAERRRAEAAEETVKLRYKELEESIYENKILQSRLQESNKFCEIFKKSQIEFEKRIEDLECRLDIALKSAEQWKKEALRLNNVEPPSITVPNDNLTREMRFNLCLKMIDQMNQIELDNLIRELNKK